MSLVHAALDDIASSARAAAVIALLATALAGTAGLGCSVDVRFSETTFRCADGVCPDGLVCNASRVCEGPGSTQQPDAAPTADGTASSVRRLPIIMNLGAGDRESDLPIPVILNESNFNFDEAAPSGSDLFVLGADGSPWPFEIAVWNDSSAVVWVKPTSLENDGTFFLYFGGGVPDASSNPSAVWSDYTGVYHLDSDGTDSSAAVGDATFIGATASSGIIGGALSLDGENDTVSLGDDVRIATATEELSMSAWFNRRGSGSGVITLGPAVAGTGSRATLEIIGSIMRARFRAPDDAAILAAAGEEQALALDEWHWFVGTINLTTKQARLYRDGVLVGSGTNAALADSFPATSHIALLGAYENDTDHIRGELDEVWFTQRELSANQIALQYRAMVGALLTFGESELLDSTRIPTRTN